MSPLSPSLDVTNQNSHYFYSKLLALTLAVILNSGLLPAQGKLSDHDLALRNETLTHSTKSNSTPEQFYIEELPFNTSAYEYATGFYDGKLIVVTNRKVTSTRNSLFDQSEFKLMGIKRNLNTWEHPHLLAGIFSGKEDHGGITFSADLTRVYYTKAILNSSRFELFTAERSSKYTQLWKNPKKVLNLDGPYSIENPWLSADGRLLYFASNKPGGYGGYDLYTSQVLPDGSLGQPKNLGSYINTDLDENFPSLNNYDTLLYFASNKSGGFGGFDLYKCRVSQGNYSNPQNLGSAINTAANELGLVPESENFGYYSSDKDALGRNTLNIYSYEAR